MKKFLIAISIVICMMCMAVITGCANTETRNENIFTITIDGENTQVLKGQKAALPEPKNSDGNKVFVGWQTRDGKTFDPNTIIDSDITIVSLWRDKLVFTLTFDSEEHKVREGDTFTAPIPASRQGFEFVGWFTGNMPYDERAAVMKDCAYESRWTEIDKFKDLQTMTFVEMGNLGGVNTAAWKSYAARDDDGVAFRFEKSSKALADDGVGIFINVGERTGTARNGATFLIRVSAAERIEISNYPNNAKQTLIVGEKMLGNGIFARSGDIDGGSVLETFIPYEFFGGVDAEYSFDQYDVMGFTMTGEDFATGKYDEWICDDMPGAGGSAKVDRMNLADYMRLSYDGVPYEYDKNDADVFITGNAGQANVGVSCNGETAISNADGDYTLALLRGDVDSLELTFEKAAYVTATEIIALDKGNIYYTATDVVLDGVKADVTGIVKDYVSGAAVAGANISSDEYGTVLCGADGKFVLKNVDLSKTLSLTVTAENYGDIKIEYTSDKLITQDFIAEVSLVSRETSFAVRGSVKDFTGAMADVSVSGGGVSVNTASDGSFTLNVNYGDVTLTFECDGYETVELIVKESELLSGEAFEYSVGAVEMKRTPVSLGVLGGEKVVHVWHGKATRDSDGLYFEYTSDGAVPDSDTIGVGIFLNMDYPRYSYYRTANTYLIGIYTSGKIAVNHYPGTTKKAATLEGLRLDTIKGNNSVMLKLFVPYTAFNAKNIPIGAASDIGISMTADFDSKTWDVWNRSDLLGCDNDKEVDRENSLDYLVLGAKNTLTEYDITMDRKTFESIADKFGALQENKPIFENIATVTGSTIKPIAEGQAIFSDRVDKFKFSTMIDAVSGMNFTYDTIANGPDITVENAGYLILVLPATGSYKPIRTAAENAGWVMTLQGYNVTGALTDRLNYYVKWCEAGEQFAYGKWNFFIL